MKKTIYTLTMTMFLAGAIFTSCDSAAKKEEEAKEDVKDAQEDLKDAKAEVQRVANAEEWSAFKTAAQLKIDDNEKLIAALKVKLKKPGKVLDPLYRDRIEVLEKQNSELRSRISSYEANQSDWEKFKREFDHDIDGIGAAIKDLGENNKN